ncbi:TPA: conjugal transfer protein TraN [Pseudomonas aeruginosa]|nr:conjugal transfer protein TraN [Pseudomonas aeruginosa]HDV6143724.1 conjugal transfer protein TraN [Pseudomonas aeruginosa]HDV6167184.1 conjugal transfer protein TraN [Pseudomonas aeruginosa]
MRKILASVTLFFYCYANLLPAWADVITKSAAEGNKAAMNAMETFQKPTLKDGEILFGNGGVNSSIKVQDLFPGALDVKDDQSSAVYGDDEKTLELGGQANTRLATEKSMDGDAYRTLKGSVQMIRPDLSKDPIWSSTDDVNDNMQMFEQEFADCSKTSTIKKGVTTKHIPDYKTCEKINDQSGSATLKHSYSAKIIKYKSGPANLQSCGPGCLLLWIGQVGDNYWDGNCSIFEAKMSVTVMNPDAITSATLEYAKWDDYMQVYLGGDKVWSGPNSNFPPETAGKCELSTSWNANPGVDISKQFKRSGDLDFKIRVSVSGSGEGYARVKVLYDPAKAITEDSWYDKAALEKAKAISDGFCAGSTFTCTDMPEAENGCINVNGVQICESYLKPSPLPGISPLCREVAIEAQCGFYKGPMECYVDAQGVEQCPVNSDTTCAINHSMNVSEVPLVAKAAVVDRTGSGEKTRVAFDLLNGTYQNLTDASPMDGYADASNLDFVCKKDSSGKLLPHKFAVSLNSVWNGSKFAPNILASGAATIVQMPSCENKLKMIVDIADTGAGSPGKYYSHQFIVKNVRVSAESWGPQSCIDSANAIKAGQCSEGGTVKVTKGVTSGCLPISGIQICPGDDLYNALKPSPVNGVDKLAQQISVTGCVKGAITQNSCEKFENDKTCGFISQECVGGAVGSSGACYVTEQVWDCGYDTTIETGVLETEYKCDGPVRCMGKECYSPTDEKSNDFAYAAAALQIAQFAEHDLDCGDEDPNNTNQNRNCIVWKGEAMECKKAVGGWVDCCEAPDGVSLMDYVSLTMNTINASQQIYSLSTGVQTQGLWTTYAEPLINQGWQAVTSSVWGTAADAAAAGTEALATEAAQTISMQAFKQALMNTAAEWTAKLFGNAAANMIFASGSVGAASTGPYATTTSTGATSLGGGTAGGAAGNATFAPMFGAMLSVIMIAYMIYQIANILVQIIWECEDKEFELGAKKETKVCHFLGSYCASESAFGCIEKRESYCCFNSPLGRIIHEQARPQLGFEWGEPETPNCGGLTIEQIGKIDWSKVDISEWIGILNVTGNYPTINNVSLDQLTGTDTILNVDGNRKNTLDRNKDRMNGMDVPGSRKDAEDEIRNGLF